MVILKIPSRGGLVHLATQEIFQRVFPKGVMNFLSGSGKIVASTVMQNGVDIFACVGTSSTADALIKMHPKPHRLTVNLSLEGKNIAIVSALADLEKTTKQVVKGTVNFHHYCTRL